MEEQDLQTRAPILLSYMSEKGIRKSISIDFDERLNKSLN